MAIGLARRAFDVGRALGFRMRLLDLGGGMSAQVAGGTHAHYVFPYSIISIDVNMCHVELLLNLGRGMSAQVAAGAVVGMGGVPDAVNAALALHFPIEDGVTVIAEPGRCAC